MTNLKLTQLMIALILLCTHGAALGADPNHEAPQLRFVAGRASLHRFAKRPPIVPTHKAYFNVAWRFTEPDDPNAEDLLKTSAGKALSDRQRDLLEEEQAFWLYISDSKKSVSKSEFGEYQSGGTGYVVYAVSEEDAGNMARAVVEFLLGKGTAKARRNVEQLRVIQPQLSRSIPAMEEEIRSKESDLAGAYQKYLDAIQNSAYSKHMVPNVHDEVRKTIFEMDKMLDVLNIEIVGIQSKLSAISKYSDQKDVVQSQTLTLTLREMAIRQEIELVGAESRRQAIMSVKRREEALYSHYRAHDDLRNDTKSLENELGRNKRLLYRIEEQLSRLEPGDLTFTIGDENRITVGLIDAS